MIRIATLLEIALITLVVGLTLFTHGFTSHSVATIGGTDVPNTLHCEEDEVISFVGIPDTLVCVHFENVR